MAMMDSGTSVQTWMVDLPSGLRTGRCSTPCSQGLPGTADAIIDALGHLVAQRRDERTVDCWNA